MIRSAALYNLKARAAVQVQQRWWGEGLTDESLLEVSVKAIVQGQIYILTFTCPSLTFCHARLSCSLSLSAFLFAGNCTVPPVNLQFSVFVIWGVIAPIFLYCTGTEYQIFTVWFLMTVKYMEMNYYCSQIHLQFCVLYVFSFRPMKRTQNTSARRHRVCNHHHLAKY